MKDNEKKDSIVPLFLFGVILFVAAYLVDIDKLAKRIDDFLEYYEKTEDPVLFIGTVVVAFIIAGLLMVVELSGKK